MDITELLNRASPQHYTIDEAQFIVEKYIEKRKGVKIKVNIFKNFPNGANTHNPFEIFMLQAEIQNLFNAMVTASNNYYL